ncbi:MAG TPA: cell wall hydrolase [Rhizomicrobium sp.]|nr:cell wall hydrolase [Rhizomicrobium sp.]
MKRKYAGLLLRSERLLLVLVASGVAALSMGASSGTPAHSFEVATAEIVQAPTVEIPAIPAEISMRTVDSDVSAQILAEYRCLAEVMYYEARGEGEEGEKAVAEVVFHRVAEGVHGPTICAVVYEGAHRSACQFSFACNGARAARKSPQVWREAEVLAARILTGQQHLSDETSGATYYHATYVRPSWAPELIRTVQIGKHVFYRDRSPVITVADNSFRGSLW